ncbi:MAG TPA: DinB family protein [Pyrinomonadaceae bacterium]|nr:DinB family protein [Pyrinomonadaceae bacterium]
MNEAAQAFIVKARSLLGEEYLPKIERCLERLSDEEIWWRANQESNSIGNLLLHLSGNARQWIVSGVGQTADGRVRQLEFDQREVVPREELLRLVRQTLSEVDDVLARLDPAGVLESRRIQGYDVTVLEAVFHVVEHFSMHTGQIILMTKLLKASDLKFYDFSGGDPKAGWRASE